MPGSVLNTWSGTLARNSGFVVPGPEINSTGVPVANSKGNWLMVVVSWRQDAGAAGLVAYPTTISVSDDAHNFWIPGKSNSVSGVQRSSVWFAPGARAAQWVYFSSTGFQNAASVLILEVSANAPWFAAGANITNIANQATSISATISSAAGLFAIGVISSDKNSVTVTPTATGWTAQPTVVATNGADTAADITQRVWTGTTGTSSSTISATAGAAVDLGIVIISFRGVIDTVTAPVQKNPNWPLTYLEMGFGSYLATPPDSIAWTDISARMNNDAHTRITRSVQYNQQSLEAGTMAVSLDNSDGLLTPGNAASPYFPYAGDCDIPIRFRTIWTGGSWEMSFHGSGAVASPQADTGQVLNVVAGQSYSIGMWLACSVAYAAGVTVAIQFRTAGGGLLSTVISSPVTGIDAQLATAGGVAPATAAKANVVVTAAGTPAVGTIFFAAASKAGPGYLTVPPGVAWIANNSATVSTLGQFAFQRQGPPNVSPYSVLFSGFTEASPYAWDAVLRGYVAMTATDAWGRLTAQMLTAAQEEVLQDNPVGYWRCSDAVGSGQAANIANSAAGPMVVQISKNGKGNAVAAFGSSNITQAGFPGDPSATCWNLSKMVAGAPDFDNGYSLAYFPADPTTLPNIANGITFEFWAQVDPGPAQPGTGAQRLVLAGCYGPRGPLWQLTIEALTAVSPGALSFIIYDQVTGSQSLFPLGSTGVNNYDGNNKLFTVTFTRTAFTVNVDATGWATVTGGANFSPVYQGFIVNGQNGGTGNGGSGAGGAGTVGACWNGSVYGIALYATLLPLTRQVAHYAIPVFAENNGQEKDTDRIRRVIGYGNGYVPVLASRGTDLGTLTGDDESLSFVQPVTDTQGQIVSAYVTNMAQSAQAGMFVDGPGNLVYRTRLQWYQRNGNRWSIGENDFAGESPYSVSPIITKDRTLLYNQAVITQSGDQQQPLNRGNGKRIEQNSSGVTVQEQNVASVAQRGAVPFSGTSYLTNTQSGNYQAQYPSVEDFAFWVVNTQGAPSLRVDSIQIDPAGTAACWPLALYGEIGDTAVINRRPPDGVNFNLVAWISRLEHDISFGDSATWGVTYQISAAPQVSVLDCDDPVNGVLDGTSLIGW